MEEHTHHHADATGAAEELAVCPVMHVKVNKREAEHKGLVRTANDTKYYLCCNTCASQFDADPKKYTGAEHAHDHDMDMNHDTGKNMALSATLHCLTGCAIGEMVGVTIGTHAGLYPHQTVILASALSFVSGYSFSTWPLLKAKLSFFKALRLVFAADTLSILAMTIADNLIMLTIPGAMNKSLAHPVYWISRVASLTVAFIVAYPVNRYLLKQGKGHTLTHHYMHQESD